MKKVLLVRKSIFVEDQFPQWTVWYRVNPSPETEDCDHQMNEDFNNLDEAIEFFKSLNTNKKSLNFHRTYESSPSTIIEGIGE